MDYVANFIKRLFLVLFNAKCQQWMFNIRRDHDFLCSSSVLPLTETASRFWISKDSAHSV